jgi:hypothetical protein
MGIALVHHHPRRQSWRSARAARPAHGQLVRGARQATLSTVTDRSCPWPSPVYTRHRLGRRYVASDEAPNPPTATGAAAQGTPRGRAATAIWEQRAAIAEGGAWPRRVVSARSCTSPLRGGRPASLEELTCTGVTATASRPTSTADRRDPPGPEEALRGRAPRRQITVLSGMTASLGRSDAVAMVAAAVAVRFSAC